jgi:Cof subfamily protein (haloacid dehalogenase superfamily)
MQTPQTTDTSPQSSPSQIRLIAIDIDGTLLTPQKQITPRTREAIQEARQEGIIVTLATARRYYNTAPIASELEVAIPLIVCDGSLIIEHPDGDVLYTNLLNIDVAQQAVEIMVRRGVQPIIHHINGTFEELRTGPGEFDNSWLATYFASYPHEIMRLPYVTCCTGTGQPEPVRVVAFDAEEVITDLIPEISALPCSWNMTKRGMYGCSEITVMNEGCTKASGVAALAGRLGIALDEVMAIGDNTNDSEMLQTVGWGVAMGQAPESVKAAAQAVTTTNTEDGVAQAIERYALRRGPLCSTQADSNSLNREICR